MADEKKQGGLRVTVTRSAGEDRAVLVFIDTAFEPTGADGSTGLRVLINDDEAWVGTAYDFGRNHEAKSVEFEVSLDDIAYTGKEID
jgi:hypothetical protein